MLKVITKLALASAALFGISSSANAFIIVSLQDLNTAGSLKSCDTSAAIGIGPGANCSVADGFDVNSADNVEFLGTVGNFLVTNASGTNNFPGTVEEAYVTSSQTNVENIAVAGTGIDELYVNVRSFGFTLPADEFKTFFGSASLSSTKPGSGGTVFNRFTADPANSGALTNPIDCTNDVLANDSCNTGALIVWQDVTPLNGFSIRTEQYFKLDAQTRAGTTATATVGTVPEPMTTSLVGGALLALALSSRRRSAKGKS